MQNGNKVRKADLDRSAHALLGFLERNQKERIFDYRFGHSYPKNSCESVSLILTYLLEEKYQLDTVTIIQGTRRDVDEHHYWVIVDDLIYDLTVHQFPGQSPIIGGQTHTPFLDEFPDREIERGRNFVDRASVIAAYRAGVIPF
jgi:hypothetical protein